jgi:hypothetical protein
MKSNHTEFLTPLTPAQCVERLAAVVDSEQLGLFSVAGLNPVIGEVTESSLRLRKRIGYRNSFQTYLTAALRPTSGGTVLSCDLATHPLVRMFMYFWFGIVALVGAPAYLALLGPVTCGPAMVEEHALIGLLVPPTMLAFGLALVGLGRFLARDEADFLVEFLARTLDARNQSA